MLIPKTSLTSLGVTPNESSQSRFCRFGGFWGLQVATSNLRNHLNLQNLGTVSSVLAVRGVAISRFRGSLKIYRCPTHALTKPAKPYLCDMNELTKLTKQLKSQNIRILTLLTQPIMFQIRLSNDGTGWNDGTNVCRMSVMSCRACSHSDRDTIDHQLIAGVPVRTIVAATGLSLGGLTRHKQHLKETLGLALRKRTPEQSEEHASSLLSRVEELITEAQQILTTAKADKDPKSALNAVNALARLLELLGRVSGELAQPNAGGLHLTLNSTKVTVNKFDGDDVEFATMIGEATNGFDVAELLRLKRIAETDEHLLPAHSVQPPCNGPSNSLNPQD